MDTDLDCVIIEKHGMTTSIKSSDRPTIEAENTDMQCVKERQHISLFMFLTINREVQKTALLGIDGRTIRKYYLCEHRLDEG
jgi:hypothetical protein